MDCEKLRHQLGQKADMLRKQAQACEIAAGCVPEAGRILQQTARTYKDFAGYLLDVITEKVNDPSESQ